MPPKPKFTRDEIVAAALDMVSERGMEALTARDLGQRLGSSARPIFTVFENMEEVQKEVRKAAMQRYN
ncbi:MAG: helix-turn-helix domain-containing protein, partial [Lachnoclostridium sp.]|nr:helix-turn-helix domain-containing protein [Lachnoclostridium sp.]